MADGYGFGGEGDWKTAALLAAVKAMGAGRAARHLVHGGLHLPLRAGRAEDPRRAHARGLPDASPRPRPSCEIHPLGIGGREDPVRLVFDAAPGPAIVIGIVDMGDRFRLVANDDRGRPARRAAAEPARRPRGLEARAVAVDVGRAVAHRRRPAPHRAHQATSTPRPCTTSPTMLRTELLVIDADTTPSAFADRIRWNQAYYRLAHGL